MSWQRANYSEVRSNMQPGDVVAFGGKGDFSELIKWTTRSGVSHVGVIVQSKMVVGSKAQPGFFNQVIESTSLDGFSGVAVSRLSDRVDLYQGEMWWLPLSGESREKLKPKKFFDWCLHQKRKKYDVPQAIKSALDRLDKVSLIGSTTHNTEDFSKFFCSELVAAALEQGGVINRINASEVTPINLCMFNLFSAKYYQLKGPKKAIHGYNTVNPEGFGV